MMRNSTTIIQRMTYGFNYYMNQVWADEGDKRVVHYPLMTSGPWPVVAIVAAYLYFVKVLGPRFMYTRPPMKIKDIMVTYNFTMVFLSGWMFTEGSYYLRFGYDTWGCPRPDYSTGDPETRRFIFVAWLFFFSKIIELADTIFMILRKKFQQITTLHVIHHSIVPFSVWLGLKFAPIGSNSWFPLMNSFVHTIMYLYFGLMALGDSLSPKRMAQLRIYKPWITRLQISQFSVAILHCIIASIQTNCHFPRTFFILNGGNAVLFLGLFFNFYREAYTFRKYDETPNKKI